MGGRYFGCPPIEGHEVRTGIACNEDQVRIGNLGA